MIYPYESTEASVGRCGAAVRGRRIHLSRHGSLRAYWGRTSLSSRRRCISSARNQNSTNPRNVVSCIERIPLIADKGLKPRCEIAGRVGRRGADITEVTGAISRRNVQCATERYGQVGVVATDPSAFLVCFGCGLRHARVLMAKGDTLMHEIADGLNASPARPLVAKQSPG